MNTRLSVLIIFSVITGVALASCHKTQSTSATSAIESNPGENRPDHDEACEQASIGDNESFSCEFDTQCVICHDGSDCGVVVNEEEFRRRGEECQKEDTADCEYSTTRCCSSHCILSPF